jgi:hypothetical protein
VPVSSPHADPRFGETTVQADRYRAGQAEAEPSPDLFEVSSSFKVLDGNTLGIERELELRRKD